MRNSDAEVHFEPESSSRFKEHSHSVGPIVMSRVSNELIMPPHVHSVQTAGYEIARPRGLRYPKGGPRGGPRFENSSTVSRFSALWKGLQSPYSSVRSRPAPPAFQRTSSRRRTASGRHPVQSTVWHSWLSRFRQRSFKGAFLVGAHVGGDVNKCGIQMVVPGTASVAGRKT
jgi:hypothetical protein